MTIVFDPKKHPRDAKGRFMRILEALKPNEEVSIKGGGTVRKEGRGLALYDRLHAPGGKPEPKADIRGVKPVDAAKYMATFALDDAAAKTSPEAPGGNASYDSFEEATHQLDEIMSTGLAMRTAIVNSPSYQEWLAQHQHDVATSARILDAQEHSIGPSALAAHDDYIALVKRIANASKTGESKRIQAVSEVLNMTRPRATDGKYRVEGGGVAAKNMMKHAISVYPKDWMEQSDANPVKLTVHPNSMANGVAGPNAPLAGFYNDVSGNMEIHEPSAQLMGHELAHRMEHSVIGIVPLEFAYWKRRTGRTDAYDVGGSAQGYPGDADQFMRPYTGRIYTSATDYAGGTGVANVKHTEILSTGVERLFDETDDWSTDPDHIDFTLGMLAAGADMRATDDPQFR